MSDESKVTAKSLRLKRIGGAFRMMMEFVITGPKKQNERDLYALNVMKDMTESERIDLMGLLISTFPADVAENVVQTWFEGAGYPMAALMEDPIADARLWADGANRKELDAYAVASFDKMSPSRRQQFLKWAQRTAGEGK